MKKTLQPASVALALSALWLLGAATISDPQTLLKRGDEAVARGDYDTAVELYKQAEMRTTEPGEVAFRLAVAKYHLAASPDSSELAEAEELFRCCLARDDKNRAAALFGLGNCLLQKAKGRNLDMVRSAIEAYELSSREGAITEPLSADIKYNLERAKLLALQLSAPPASKDPNTPPPGNEDNPKNPPPEMEHAKDPPGTQENSGTSKTNKNGKPKPVKPEAGQNPIQTEEQPAPGVGSLQPILDVSEPTPVPPKEAVSHLELATQRVLQEREAYRRQKVRPNVSGVRDW
jgi:tetratricopeptide (TPR) repeat protein